MAVDFNLLKGNLQKSTLLLPGDEGYADSLKRWSVAAERNAAAVALVECEEDISLAVKFATQNGVEIAVHGGGHSSSGSSSVEGGMVIDLSRMRCVTVDPERRLARVQGGALWVDVDEETAKHGLGCVAGTVNHTGVGGLTLGGGYGWLSGRHGLTTDNLVSVRMVLADGRIVTASEGENEDLFWAVRGAGSSFGVAVEFCFKAHPVPARVTFGGFVFPPERMDQVTDYVNFFYDTLLDADCGLFYGFSAPPPALTPLIKLAVLYIGPKAEAERKFEGLTALQPLGWKLDEVPYEKLNGVLNEGLEHGSRRGTNGSSASMPLDQSMVRRVHETFADLVRTHPAAGESLVLFEILHPGKICEVPITQSASVMRTRSINVGILTKWDDAGMDGDMRTWSRALAGMIREMGHPMGSFTSYANYSYVESRSRELFGVNYDRLVSLKKKYDANNLFHSWHDLSGTQDNKEFAA